MRLAQLDGGTAHISERVKDNVELVPHFLGATRRRLSIPPLPTNNTSKYNMASEPSWIDLGAFSGGVLWRYILGESSDGVI